MAGTAAVIFMTVMVGISSNNSRPPSVAKETTVIEASNALPVCRALETAFHNAAITVHGETKVSVEKYDGDSVRRESTCKQINL